MTPTLPIESARDLAHPSRKINWLEDASRSITAAHAPAGCCADYVAERLSALLLQRLPADTAKDLIDFLPEHEIDRHEEIRNSAQADADTSLGYPDFIECARNALSFYKAEGLVADSQTAQKLADTYLWSFAQELPAPIKERMTASLPSELRNRINLYSASMDEAKVA